MAKKFLTREYWVMPVILPITLNNKERKTEKIPGWLQLFLFWTCCETFETNFGDRSEQSYKELRSLKGGKENIKLEILLKEKDSTTWFNPRPRRVKRGRKFPRQRTWLGASLKSWFPLEGDGSFATSPKAGGMKFKFTTFGNLVFSV